MATRRASAASAGNPSGAAKKSSRKKSASKKYGPKASKYGPKASESVEREMKAFKEGKLKSGSGRKVTSRKQAVAIGLSEARKSGAKVPSRKSAG